MGYGGIAEVGYGGIAEALFKMGLGNASASDACRYRPTTYDSSYDH